ncbi:MAG TPA: hypothetical protein VGP03_08190 [Pseudonocardiaceae bacterium]|nr:hypothetical protein [Pseudonocardiaceae bacterium]
MREHRRSPLAERESTVIRRIQHLAQRAERTAHNRSNMVGPPPSQEHLDILAEIRALTAALFHPEDTAAVAHPARPVDGRHLVAEVPLERRPAGAGRRGTPLSGGEPGSPDP